MNRVKRRAVSAGLLAGALYGLKRLDRQRRQSEYDRGFQEGRKSGSLRGRLGRIKRRLGRAGRRLGRAGRRLGRAGRRLGRIKSRMGRGRREVRRRRDRFGRFR